MKEGARFGKRYFLHKVLNAFGLEGSDVPTKETDQIYRKACFETIFIKDLTSQDKRRAQEAIIIL